jgi:hypothetical protein
MRKDASKARPGSAGSLLWWPAIMWRNADGGTLLLRHEFVNGGLAWLLFVRYRAPFGLASPLMDRVELGDDP